MDTNRSRFLTCKMSSTVAGSDVSMLMLNEPVVYLFLFMPADPLATLFFLAFFWNIKRFQHILKIS